MWRWIGTGVIVCIALTPFVLLLTEFLPLQRGAHRIDIAPAAVRVFLCVYLAAFAGVVMIVQLIWSLIRPQNPSTLSLHDRLNCVAFFIALGVLVAGTILRADTGLPIVKVR